LLLVNLGTLDLLVEFEEFPLVLSLQRRQLLVFVIPKVLNPQIVVLLVILEAELQLCLLLKGTLQAWVDVDVQDLAALEADAVCAELFVEIGDHSDGHVRLQIEDLRKPDRVDEASHGLISLSRQQLIEAASAQAVDEFLNFLLDLRHAEREVNVDIDVGVVLGRAALDGRIVIDDVLRQQGGHASIAAVAPVRARRHEWLGGAAILLKNGEIGGYIKFKSEAAALMVDACHDNNGLVVLT